MKPHAFQPGTVVPVLVLLTAPFTTVTAQPSLDTVRIFNPVSIQVNGSPQVAYPLGDVADDAILFGKDSGFTKIFGFIDGVDTNVFPESYHWVKDTGVAQFDTWLGILPTDDPVETFEQVSGFGMISVPAGDFMALVVLINDRDMNFIGTKYFAEGVGLLRWELSECYDYYEMDLVDYNVIGGTGYMPLYPGNQWVYQTTETRYTLPAETTTISVDGQITDWLPYFPLVLDGPGDDSTSYTGADIASLWAAVDDTGLFLAMSFWDGDANPTYGQTDPFAYTFVLDNDLGNMVGVGHNGSNWYLTGFGIDVSQGVVACDSIVEVYLPLANLGSPDIINYYWAMIGDQEQFDATCFVRLELAEPCPLTLMGDVNLSGTLTSADIIYMVNAYLKAGPPPLPCQGAGDVNCSGTTTSADIIYLVNNIFGTGPPPCDICSLIPGVWTCP